MSVGADILETFIVQFGANDTKSTLLITDGLAHNNNRLCSSFRVMTSIEITEDIKSHKEQLITMYFIIDPIISSWSNLKPPMFKIWIN